MKVHAVYEPERHSVRIYIESGATEDGRRVYTGSDHKPYVVAPGQEPPMYMRLDSEIAQAVAEALQPKPVASERHLDDAIMIRDRLMRLVEAQLMPPQFMDIPREGPRA